MSTHWLERALQDTRDALASCREERDEARGKNQRAFDELDSATIDLRSAVRHMETALAAIKGEEIVA